MFLFEKKNGVLDFKWGFVFFFFLGYLKFHHVHQVLILSCTSESVWMHFNNWSSKTLTPEYLILQVYDAKEYAFFTNMSGNTSDGL